LVPKSVTLNDLELRNDRYVALFFIIILDHGCAVLIAIAELLFVVSNLHTLSHVF